MGESQIQSSAADTLGFARMVPPRATPRSRLGTSASATSIESVKTIKSVRSVKSARSMRSLLSNVSRGRQSVESVLDSFRLNRRNSTLLEDEIEDAIDPNAVEIQVWQQVLLACLLFEVCVIPFILAFPDSDSDATLAIEYSIFFCCEAMFLLDIYVQAHTGYYEDGNVVRDKRKTRRRFFRSRGFALDMVAIVPLSLLPIAPSVTRIVLEMHKLTRCWRLGKYVSNLDSFYARHFAILKLLKVMVATMLVSHFVACARSSFGYDVHHNNHWLPRVPQHALSVRSQYLMSLFWAFGILSGLFEGELPHSIPEFVFTIVVALCGFSLFTSLCAMFFMVSKCESGHTEELEARINQLKHLLRFHRVPESLQTQAIDYLKRYYTDAESNDREATKLLCPSIAKDIQVELLKSTVAQIPLFAGCSDQFIVAVAGLLEMRSVPAQFVLCEAGDFGDAMYIVHSGVLNVVINGVKVREMRKGVCFGELSVFSTSPRTATVVSATYAILYQLSRFHSERVMEGYPECAATIAAHVVHMLENAKKKPSASTEMRNDSVDATSDRQRSSVLSTRQSILLGALLIRKSITSSTWYSRKANHVIPAHEDVIAESMHSPRPDGSAETPETAVQKRADQQTFNYYSHSLQSQEDTSQSRPWRALLLRTCIDADSHVRMWWIFALMVNLIYNWLLVPLQLSFPVMHRPLPAVIALNTLADAVLVVDMYLNLNLSFTLHSEKITSPVRSAAYYVRHGLLFDLVCVLPYWTVTSSYGLARVPRLFRVLRLTQHLNEVDKYIRLSSKQRLLLFGLLLIMLYHIIACVHFAVSYIEGFSAEEEAWIPCEDIFLQRINDTHFQGRHDVVYVAPSTELNAISHMQYFRSLYYATNVLAALGKTVEPDSDMQYAIAIVLMLSGFLITAIVVDNVQKRFTASAYEQKEFFAVRTRMQLFLRRQNAPIAIHHRMNSFLDYWWSSHRGAMIGELLADLPPSIRHDILRSICNPVLQTLALVAGVRTVLDQLEDVMVENLKFVLYGQGEVVYRQGDYATGVFFLLEGEVCVITESSSPRGVPLGGFFGTASLVQNETTDGYSEHVSATSSCILLFLASEHLRAMEVIFPHLPAELLVLEKRLLGNKLAKVDVGVATRRGSVSLEQPSSRRKSGIAGLFDFFDDTVFDPDSTYVLVWEIWLFLVMTIQWITALFQICFRTATALHKSSDAVTFFLEIWFFVDVFIRLRLGYYEYGNKIMVRKQIRRTYLRSGTFALDLLALVPLYMVNWFRDPMKRLDVVNINKLLRLFKVARQFAALENRFLKFTMELRLLKLLYYTFMLTHIFGCFWFDFATNASHLGLSGQHPHSGSGDDSSVTPLEESKWMPSETLRHAHLTMQYAGSIFWAFGLMSASQSGELPKTVPQCIFSVVTMTSGFFLFAYVVGNFMDIIELIDAENREFNAKMGAVRNMLAHFKLPASLEDRLKTFFFFKRFHSITQEHILERCLPPSLLTDIRLVHLKPMIAKVAFLSGMEGSVTRMLVSQFSQCVVLRGQFVCRYGEEGSDMYFIFTGILDVLMPMHLAPVENERDSEHDGEPAEQSASTPLLNGNDGAVSSAIHALKKVNELSAGSYFGENGLFTKSLRNAHVCAQTSCILYKLSRDSLELVFERYPAWKQKVIRIANLQNEQQRLNRLSKEEQSRHTDEAGGSMLSKMDLLNRRAEKLEEEMHFVRVKRSTSLKEIAAPLSSTLCMRVWDRYLRRQIPQLARKLRDGAEAQSALHLFWMQIILCCTVYMAVIVPYRIALDSLDRSTPMVNIAKGLEIFCELMFAADIWFSVHVKECTASMELYEQPHSVTYKKERMVWDIIAAVPVHHILLDFINSPWLRLFHCVKVMNITSYLGELNRRSVRYEFDRVRGVWLLYVLIMYWVACAYLAIATREGYGDEWNAWAPSTAVEISDAQSPEIAQLVLRLCRGVFYATTAFVKKGRAFVPDSVTRYIFSIACSYIGLLVMSFMIGEVASLFISFIGVEVNFRRSHIAVELYLARLHVSSALSNRAHAFMFSLWSSHSGVNYETVFQEISPSIRVACTLHIAQQPLEWFMRTVFRPLSWYGSNELETLTASIAHELRFEGYPRDEFVVREGSISHAMYFVVKGHLTLQSNTLTALHQPIGIRAGDYFGERGLLGAAVSTFSVRSIRASDLLSLSSESLLNVMNNHAVSRIALLVAQESYRRLKTELKKPCPSSTMEEHWGTTLVSVLHEHVKVKAPDNLKHRASSTSLAAASSLSPPYVCVEKADEPNDLQKRWKAMALALEEPRDCYSAFRGLLHIISPNDPLDWCASFGRTLKLASTSKDAERRASFEQALVDLTKVPPVAVEAPSPTRSDRSLATSAHIGEEVLAGSSDPLADPASVSATSASSELSKDRSDTALVVADEGSASAELKIPESIDIQEPSTVARSDFRIGPSIDLIPLRTLKSAGATPAASEDTTAHIGGDREHPPPETTTEATADANSSVRTANVASPQPSKEIEQVADETEPVMHALPYLNELKGVPPKYVRAQLYTPVNTNASEPTNGSEQSHEVASPRGNRE